MFRLKSIYRLPRKTSQSLFKVLGVLFLLNLCAWIWPLRWDATRDKRYTPSEFFRKQADALASPLQVLIFLDGDLPPAWQALKAATRDFFIQYARATDDQMDVKWMDLKSLSAEQKQSLFNELQAKGGRPIWIKKESRDGSLKQEIVFPCAILSYQGKEILVNLLEEGKLQFTETDLAPSLQRYDFLLSDAMLALRAPRTKRIAFVQGNGELSDRQTRDLADYLNQYYRVSYLTPKDSLGEWNAYSVLIFAKPTQVFTEKRKLVLDQYLMQGGAAAFFLDGAQLQEDLLAQGKDAVAMGLDIGLNDFLFHYGLRLHDNLISDNQCAFIPVQSTRSQGEARFEPAPWPYYPLFQGSDQHPVSTGIFSVLGRYTSSIDTLHQPGIRKSVLLQSSPASAATGLPSLLNLSELEFAFKAERKESFISGVLCEGRPQSAFRNRPVEAFMGYKTSLLAEAQKEVRYALIGDGDLIRNELSGGTALPLGYDRFLQRNIYANRVFSANLVHYLAGEKDWVQLRDRKWEQALLDRERVRQDYEMAVALLCIAVLVWILGCCFGVIAYRKIKYGKKRNYERR